MTFEGTNLERHARSGLLIGGRHKPGHRFAALGEQHFPAGLDMFQQLGELPANSLTSATVVMPVKIGEARLRVELSFRAAASSGASSGRERACQ